MGLGTMGMNLLLNMADHGHNVAGYSRDEAKVAKLVENPLQNLSGFGDLQEFVLALRKPRVVMLLVPAGKAVDGVIKDLEPFLEQGDFVVDGGNSFYKDTTRRVDELKAKGLGFIGMGVSGGESGARRGPSMMPGGSAADYERIRPILESAAAKFNGEPCVALMGNGAAGHYVKMVHNGIEYGLMQMLAEVYDLMKRRLGLTNAQMADEFERWNNGRLQSFLVDITVHILRTKDPLGAGDLVDMVSDKARAKGTGKWTSQDAMDLGLPVPTIDAAVAARELSEYKDQRTAAATAYSTPVSSLSLTLADIEKAYFAASYITYAQGLAQIQIASKDYGFDTDLPTVAQVWRAGCIIRAAMLEPMRAAYAANPSLPNLLLDPNVVKEVEASIGGLRTVSADASLSGIPVPGLSASLAYFDGFRTARLPANLIQSQRDLFGAHTYERLDREGSFHTQWVAE